MRIEKDNAVCKFENSKDAVEVINYAFNYLNKTCFTNDAPTIRIYHLNDGSTTLQISSDEGDTDQIWRWQWYDHDKMLCFRSLESIVCNGDAEEAIRDLYNKLGINEGGAIFSKQGWVEHTAHRFATGGAE